VEVVADLTSGTLTIDTAGKKMDYVLPVEGTDNTFDLVATYTGNDAKEIAWSHDDAGRGIATVIASDTKVNLTGDTGFVSVAGGMAGKVTLKAEALATDGVAVATATTVIAVYKEITAADVEKIYTDEQLKPKAGGTINLYDFYRDAAGADPDAEPWVFFIDNYEELHEKYGLTLYPDGRLYIPADFPLDIPIVVIVKGKVSGKEIATFTLTVQPADKVTVYTLDWETPKDGKVKLDVASSTTVEATWTDVAPAGVRYHWISDKEAVATATDVSDLKTTITGVADGTANVTLIATWMDIALATETSTKLVWAITVGEGDTEEPEPDVVTFDPAIAELDIAIPDHSVAVTAEYTGARTVKSFEWASSTSLVEVLEPRDKASVTMKPIGILATSTSITLTVTFTEGDPMVVPYPVEIIDGSLPAKYRKEDSLVVWAGDAFTEGPIAHKFGTVTDVATATVEVPLSATKGMPVAGTREADLLKYDAKRKLVQAKKQGVVKDVLMTVTNPKYGTDKNVKVEVTITAAPTAVTLSQKAIVMGPDDTAKVRVYAGIADGVVNSWAKAQGTYPSGVDKVKDAKTPVLVGSTVKQIGGGEFSNWREYEIKSTKATGTATITFKAGKKSASLKVTVVGEAGSVIFNPKKVAVVGVGESLAVGSSAFATFYDKSTPKPKVLKGYVGGTWMVAPATATDAKTYPGKIEVDPNNKGVVIGVTPGRALVWCVIGTKEYPKDIYVVASAIVPKPATATDATLEFDKFAIPVLNYASGTNVPQFIVGTKAQVRGATTTKGVKLGYTIEPAGVATITAKGLMTAKQIGPGGVRLINKATGSYLAQPLKFEVIPPVETVEAPKTLPFALGDYVSVADLIDCLEFKDCNGNSVKANVTISSGTKGIKVNASTQLIELWRTGSAVFKVKIDGGKTFTVTVPKP